MLFVMISGSAVSLGAPMNLLNKKIITPEKEILSVWPYPVFSVDMRLRENVKFWVSIYTKYYSHEGVVHDSKYVNLIYEVIDLRNSDHVDLVKKSKKKWQQILKSLHKKRDTSSMTSDETYVSRLFETISGHDKYIKAAANGRIRLQTGQRENFMEGIRQSGRYLPHMEDIFKSEGLPIELTRLPFVESGFNVKARSKVGASGIWQFMKSTGRNYLKINAALDERNDPFRATEAAAKLLLANYGSLKQWPLAVTAYNHGRHGMERAVRRVGSDEIEDVVQSYKSRSFGFASSNFFCELLAVIEVEKNSELYFGKIEKLPPMNFIEATIPDYVGIKELSSFLNFDTGELMELNPALSEKVFLGSLLMPVGYKLRLPAGQILSTEAALRVFFAGYEQIPSIYKFHTQQYRRKTRIPAATERR